MTTFLPVIITVALVSFAFGQWRGTSQRSDHDASLDIVILVLLMFVTVISWTVYITLQMRQS